ncbi:unnamed protein product [Sphagnum troendelagicum]
MLIKYAQGQDVYICDFVEAIKMCKSKMYELYNDLEGSGVAGNRSSQLELEDEAAKCASLAEGKHISVSKICQGSLSALRVSAFGILGFQMQEVPSLCNLALIKARCAILPSVSLPFATSLCFAFQISFRLVNHSSSPLLGGDASTLQSTLVKAGCSTHVDVDKFMVHLQNELKAPTPEHLGVWVQSLGLHLAALQAKAFAGHLKCKSDSLSYSSDDATGRSDKKVAVMVKIVEKSSGVSKGKAINFGNCPYPSAAEVVCHLTLKEVAEFIMVLKVMCSDHTIIKVLHHHHSSLFLIISMEKVLYF